MIAKAKGYDQEITANMNRIPHAVVNTFKGRSGADSLQRGQTHTETGFYTYIQKPAKDKLIASGKLSVRGDKESL